MIARKKLRTIVFVLLGLFFAFVIADSLDVFNTKPYTAINHGDHKHYVPKDRDPEVSVSQFPTRPPGPGERITPQGQIVRDTQQ